MGLSIGLVIAGAATAIVGAAVSTTTAIIGADTEYKQQKANAKSQQELLNYNARLEQREAKAIEDENNEAARRQRLENERLKSLQRASYGKSGAAMASGSPLAVLGETSGLMEVGVQDTHRTGARQYNQRMAQANSFMYQGRVARGSVGKGSLISGIGGALGSGLSATGNVIMSAGSAAGKGGNNG